MEKLKVDYSFNDSIARIKLDDGKGNILDAQMMSELQTLLDSYRERPNLKLITFEGEGKHFSFGASVEEHKKENAAAMLRDFHKLFFTMRDLSIPTLAKISGQCLGGGMELALMCNFLYADVTAKMGQPEIVLGVFPPPASILLPLKIGYASAEEILMSGRTVPAQEALQLGLLNNVYEDRIVMEKEVDIWIEEYILPKSASSLRFAVKACRVEFNNRLTQYLPQLETIYVTQLMETKDANEGINSFLEKRKPVWENC